MTEKVDISVVIPAFNEAGRLPLFLDRVVSFCGASKKEYEVIVVDDGSSDGTFEIAASYHARFPNLRAFRVETNRGKGYAVKKGLLKAKGDICMFLDADGSVGPEEIEKNVRYISKDGYDIFVGSRVLRDREQFLKVKWYRKFAGWIFNFFVQQILFKDIKDTQCGFKMFRKEIVKPLFSRGYLDGFGFDVETLYLAHKMGYRVKEGPVSWQHVDGSKVNLFVDSIKMFMNILQIRNWHFTPINTYSGYMGPNEYEYMYELENYHWWFVSRRNAAVDLIMALKIPLPVILDVGSGTGGNLMAFGRIGRACGIDISEKAVAFCAKRSLNNVIQSPVEKIKYEEKTFDIITCLDVLEHVSSPLEALLEMKRVLKDDGRILIMVPAFRILWSQHDEALGHLRRYEKKSLTCDLHEAGLKIEKMSYLFFISFFVVAPIRIMRRFFVFRRGKARSDTTTLPPKFLNEFLKFLFNMEAKISVNMGIPFGTTLYAVVSKK